VLCVTFHRSLYVLCPFSPDHCIVCTFLKYDFWLHYWCLQIVFTKLLMVGVSRFVLYFLIHLDCTYSQTHTCCFKSTCIFIITVYTVYLSDRLIVCGQPSSDNYSMHIHNEDKCQQYINKAMQK
jgi:hypothetical protein